MQCMGRDYRLECHSLAWSPTLPSQYSRHIVHIEQIVQIVHIAHIVLIVYCALCALYIVHCAHWQKPTNEGGKRLEPVELWHKFAYLKALHCSQYHNRKFTKCKKSLSLSKNLTKSVLATYKATQHCLFETLPTDADADTLLSKIQFTALFFHCWTGG